MDSDVTTTTGVLGLPAIGEEGQRVQRTASGFSGSVHADTTEACHERRRMRAASVGSLHVEELWSSHDPTEMSGDDDTDPATPDGDDHALLTGLCTAKAKSRGSSGTGRMQPLRVRRRFHSSDVVLCTAAPTPTTAAFHPPRGGLDSPTIALRQWLASSNAELSPAHLRRHRQHRRAQSTDYTSRHCRQQEYHGMRRSSESSRPANYYYHNAIAEEIFHDDSFHDGDRPVNDESEDDVLDSESERESESDQAESDVENLHLAPRSRRAGSDDSNGSESSSFDSNAVGRSYDSVPQENPPSVEKLLNLQKLYQEGFITVTEYTNRRRQLVDELSVSKANQTINRTTDLIQRDLPVIHREPPDFTVLRERDAIKHVFDSEKRKWTSSRIKVKIDPQPFARGGLRQVFHVQDLSVIPRLGLEGRPVSYVAKIAMDENEDPDTYFRDVEMQAVASKFAKLYNSYNPPRRVEFLDAWILQLVPASNMGDDDNLTMRGTICGVEPYIAGEYHKHNNNFGYVSELERNTPQAFSHFTYEASGQQMLIVDIQGVSDHYTDPQIHTRSGKEFGKGNLSTRGFERFLESHRCNPICRYLKLPLGNPKDDGDGQEVGAQNGTQKDGRGTVPAQTYMSQPRIKRVDSELCHYYGDSKAFKKYQAKHQQHEHADVATSAFVAALKEQRHCSSFCGVGLCTIS